MSDLTPRKDFPKLELHLTYACDLECVACSRASFLRKPHTRNLTIADVEDAFRQCDELKWEPRVIIIGGEPVMHPQFYEICRMSVQWSINHRPDNFVQVFSNGHTAKTMDACRKVEQEWSCSIFRDEWKPASRVGGEPGQSTWYPGMFVSPVDAGMREYGPCYQHSSINCGVGFDAEGFSLCPPGLTIAKLLGDPEHRIHTRRLADIFDPEWAARATREMCRHCGYAMSNRCAPVEEQEQHAAYVAAQPRGVAGTPMSPTWQKAFEGRK